MSEREPEIEKSVLKTLEEIWGLYPDLRLTQLIVNAIKPKEPCSEIFYTEDSQLIEKLTQLRPKTVSEQEIIIDNIDDMLKLQQEVIGYFENIDAADIWIHTPLPVLSGNKPISCYSTMHGRDNIRHILSNMKHGNLC